MGLNAFFTFTVVLGMGKSWQVALGAVFISGLLFVLISAFKLREWIINAIPYTLKQGIVAGHIIRSLLIVNFFTPIQC